MIWDGWFLLCLFLHSSSYNLKYCWEIIYHSEKTFPVSQLALYDWEMKVDRQIIHISWQPRIAKKERKKRKQTQHYRGKFLCSTMKIFQAELASFKRKRNLVNATVVSSLLAAVSPRWGHQRVKNTNYFITQQAHTSCTKVTGEKVFSYRTASRNKSLLKIYTSQYYY